MGVAQATMDSDGSGAVCYVEFRDWWQEFGQRAVRQTILGGAGGVSIASPPTARTPGSATARP